MIRTERLLGNAFMLGSCGCAGSTVKGAGRGQGWAGATGAGARRLHHDCVERLEEPLLVEGGGDRVPGDEALDVERGHRGCALPTAGVALA